MQFLDDWTVKKVLLHKISEKNLSFFYFPVYKHHHTQDVMKEKILGM